jgi:hypothetical protein
MAIFLIVRRSPRLEIEGFQAQIHEREQAEQFSVSLVWYVISPDAMGVIILLATPLAIQSYTDGANPLASMNTSSVRTANHQVRYFKSLGIVL